MFQVVGHGVGQWRQTADRGLERRCRQRGPLVPIAGELVDALEYRSKRLARETIDSRVQLAFTDQGDGHSLRRDARLRQESRRVGHHDLAVVLVARQPVDHDDQRKTALANAAEDLERDEIRIPRRRGDEHAEVGGLDQRVRELAVRTFDGVDIGRVDDRDAGPVAGCQHPSDAAARKPSELPALE